MNIQNVELSKIHADHVAQPRAAMLVDKIGEYVEDMQRGDVFPPLVVFYDGEIYRLADGFHRYFAATTCEIAEIACDIRLGGLRDAILYSCGANAAHGLRRSINDKRRAVAKLLEDKEWCQRADSEIARQCAVSHTFIAKVRKEMAIHTCNVAGMADNPIKERKFQHSKTPGFVSVMTYVQRDKTEIDAAGVGRAMHEIERHMDSLPSPADTLARFPEDQFYLFPVTKLESMAAWLTEFAALWRKQIEERASAAG